ncbi:MAG: hypothetical protein KDK78_07560, partial [Chlamydiia bacterium]|nr:hypothetical protein [Chlamydiia bacterium]
MTAPIDHDQFRHLLSEVKTQSTKDQRAYIRRFDTAIVDQLNPEERHRLFSLGRQSGGFYCHRQTLHWGETAIRANALALKLLGLQSDGERINTEALPDWASTDLLIRWCYRTKSPKLKSAGDKEQFAQSSLFILDWLRRNSTEPFINDFKQFVDTYKTGFCFPTHQCELFRQGLFQWGDLGDSILKEVCAPYHSWTPDSQKLTLSSSSPKARDAAQSALRYLPPISEIEFNRGWTGQEIFQLLSNLSSDRREGIVSLKIVDTLEIEREEFIAILDRLPRIKQLSILKSKMDEWPDLLELLKDHAPFIEKLSIDGACGRAIHEGLGWPKSGGIVYFACDSFYFCYDRVREALMKDRGYSLFLSLHPRLRNRIICEAFTGLSYTSNLSFEGLVRLRDTCTETPPKAYKLLDIALDQL